MCIRDRSYMCRGYTCPKGQMSRGQQSYIHGKGAHVREKRCPGAKVRPLPHRRATTTTNVFHRRSAVDHATTKRTNTVIDNTLFVTLERLHFGDDRPAGGRPHETIRLKSSQTIWHNKLRYRRRTARRNIYLLTPPPAPKRETNPVSSI